MNYRSRVLLINGLWVFLLTQSIVVPFFSQHDLGMTEIFMIQVVHSLMLLIFDVPSSYFADKFGRKKILLLAGLARGIGGCLFYFSTNFSDFLITYTVIGFGNSLFSGAGLSILYDDDDKSNQTNPLLQNYNITKFFSISAFFIGSLLATFSLDLPAFVNMITAWLPLLLIITLRNPRFSCNKSLVSLNAMWRFVKTNNSTFFILCFFSAFYSSIAVINLYFSQAVFMSLSKSLYVYGILMCFSQLIMTIFSRWIRINKYYQPHIVILLWLMTPIVYLLFSSNSIVIFFIAVLLSECIRWINQIHVLNWINHDLNVQYRSTLNSIINFLSVLVVVFVGPFVGHFVNGYDHDIASYFLAALFFILPSILYFFYKRRLCYIKESFF